MRPIPKAPSPGSVVWAGSAPLPLRRGAPPGTVDEGVAERGLPGASYSGEDLNLAVSRRVIQVVGVGRIRGAAGIRGDDAR